MKGFAICLTAGLLLAFTSAAQEPNGTAAKPLDRIIGTVSAVDQSAHTVTVKEDKTGAVYTVDLQNTKTLLKVEPTAKDLKNATRITADDLAVGDRVQVGGSKAADNPSSITARSVILMSARELQQVHQQQAAAWQHSTPGLVTAVDPTTTKLTISTRTPEGQKSVVVDASKTTEFTRYSPDNPKTPQPSQFADIRTGDQVRIIGDKSEDGSAITAQQIYSGPFRTIGGTVSSIAPDGKSITIKSAGTNQIVQVNLNDESAIHKLPPEVAMRLAMRLNPSYRPTQAAPGTGGAPGANGNAGGAPPYGAKAGEANAPSGSGSTASSGGTGSPGGWQGGAGRPGGGAGGMRGGGDLSQMMERLPKIEVSDLKPGDVVLISGAATTADNSRILATNIIAGAEPILRAAPTRQGQSSLSDWGSSLGGGGMDMGMPPL